MRWPRWSGAPASQAQGARVGASPIPAPAPQAAPAAGDGRVLAFATLGGGGGWTGGW